MTKLPIFLAVSAILGFQVSLSFAQTPDLSTSFANLKARSIGPAGMSGRVTDIDAVHANPDIIYLGSASGGVWKTENGGAEWKSVFDNQPTLNIGSVAIQQSNPSVVWVGTGEGNPRNSINLGEGIYKTLDGGNTWKCMGLQKTRGIHRVIIDPTNPQVVYAAAIGNAYGIHAERGVYKTTDGGNTWNRILYANDTTGCAELVMDPTNPNKLIANLWQHQRTPWSFTSGGPGGGLYITWDGGVTWKKLGAKEGIPDELGRIGLAIAPSDPNIVYAMIESKKNALYRSEDGGLKWQKVNEDPQWVTNRPFYFQDIRVDPSNENRLYNIYQMISQSDDGGKTFRIIIPYRGVHPDHHAWWIHPKDPSFIIDGNDGGIAISRDRGRTWQIDEKLPLGQFYHINVDNQTPYNILGGMQDNGSWRGPAYTWSIGGLRNTGWLGIGGGDGFDAAPDPEDPNWVYSMSQGGYFNRLNTETGQSFFIRPPFPDTSIRPRFNWNAAFAQDPFDHSVIYYGSQFVHKSTSKGAAWTIISPDLTTNDPIKQKQDGNGGLTIDITNAENHCTILAIEPSAKQKGLIWVGTDDGQVQRTMDGGQSWQNLTASIKGLPANSWIQQVKAGRHQAGEAFVVANNYRQGDFGVYIFRTSDFGKTWTRLADEHKVRGYALCLLQDPMEPNLIFVGTEHGLWISLDNGKNFQPFKNKFPPVSTYDLALQEREADLVIGTFGRSLYIIDDIRPLRYLASLKEPAFKKPITMLPVSGAYKSYINSPRGYDWSVDGIYAGENRPFGAPIQFFVQGKKGQKYNEENKKMDSVWVEIFKESGQSVRKYKIPVDTGFNRIWWNYATRGVRDPMSAKPKPNDPEPANGMEALAGNFKVLVSLTDSTRRNMPDSGIMQIAFDPRLPYPAAVIEARDKKLERLNKASDRLTNGMDQLREASAMLEKLEARIKDEKGPTIDSLRKHSKSVRDSIKTITNWIGGEKMEKQGYGKPYQLTTTGLIENARDLITEKLMMPGQQEDIAIANAEDMIAKSLEKIRKFIKETWLPFQSLAESTPMPLFKKLELVD